MFQNNDKCVSQLLFTNFAAEMTAHELNIDYQKAILLGLN